MDQEPLAPAAETIDSLIKNSDYRIEAIFTKLGVTKTTLWKRRKAPETFVVKEILTLAAILEREPEDIFSIILNSSSSRQPPVDEQGISPA